MLRQFRCLIEASPVMSREVQWHRDEKIGPVENGRPRHRHQPPQRACYRAALVIFQDVQDVPQRSFVRTNCAANGDQAWAARAASAQIIDAVDPPRRERVTAHPAEWLRQPTDLRPTPGADGASERDFEWSPAHRAGRGDDYRECGVDKPAKDSRR